MQTGVAAPVHVLSLVGIVVTTCGPTSLYIYAQRQLYADWRRRLRAFPALLLFGTGITLSNTRAIVEALVNVSSTFVRTPKFRIERTADTWRGKRYTSPLPWSSLAEALLAAYSGYGVALAVSRGASLATPFLLLCTLGFAVVAFLSLLESMQRYVHTLQHTPLDAEG
jgi:hypothetical protein